MDIEIAHEAESFINEVVSFLKPKLLKDTLGAVKHYLYHGEYEMAFEGLFIDIMNLETIPDIDWQKSIEIARKLKLNEESVFKENFWLLFSDYLESKGK